MHFHDWKNTQNTKEVIWNIDIRGIPLMEEPYTKVVLSFPIPYISVNDNTWHVKGDILAQMGCYNFGRWE